MPLQDPCQKFACDLQTCLRANDYQEWKCQHIMQALYDCCSRCGKGNSVVCSGIVNTSNTWDQVPPLKFSQGRIQPEEPTFLVDSPTILSLESMQPDNTGTVSELEDNNAEKLPTILPSVAPPPVESTKSDTEISKKIRLEKIKKYVLK